MKSKKHIKVQHQPPIQVQLQPVFSVKYPILALTIRLIVLLVIISLGILFTDVKGYFNPDNSNNHTDKKWNSFYEFTEKNNVDILLIGNSHLYTGINPKNLSACLGLNSFILASPGTGIADYYFSLKEALMKCKPQAVVIETYGINEVNQHEKNGQVLSDQFKSFSARKDFFTKITSTPYLFSVKNYPYAWSNTLRNHDFIYKNQEQISKNIELEKKKVTPEKKLFLGRYVRFQTGLADSTLKKYETLGASVNGSEYLTNENTNYYVRLIEELCADNEVKLIYLTLPMYSKHVSNYSDWKAKLSSTIIPDSKFKWLDLQDSVGYIGFTEHSFENTYDENQHMTYNGSLCATYKLADFLLEEKLVVPIDRKDDLDWRNMFYAEEGFFENHSPNTNDLKNKILYTATDTGIIREILHVKLDKNDQIIVKVVPNSDAVSQNIDQQFIRILTTFKDETNAVNRAYLDLPFDAFHSTKYRYNYAINIKQLEILQVNNLSFLYY